MKKILSVLLAVLLIALSFSACVSGKSENEENKGELELKAVCDFAYSADKEKASAGYEALCKAVLNGEEGARLNTDVLDSVRNLFYTSFPLSALVKEVKAKEDGSGVEIVYTNEIQEHKKLAAEFVNKINEITASCASGNVNVYALNVYHYVTSNINVSENGAIDCYQTIMKGEGTSFSYARMLSYLLMLGGVESAYVTALDAGNSGWGLCQVVIDNQYYYLDPMTEYYDNGGELIRYFGMTENDLKKEGLKEPNYSNTTACHDASDLRFDVCRYCRSYEIKDNNLLVSTTQGEIVSIAL